MGDLVRFWYAALFLFASAYALIHEGHVRVDVLYTSFSESKKAWTNTIGSSILGIPPELFAIPIITEISLEVSSFTEKTIFIK